MERNFKILNCVSKRLDSGQEAKDHIDDANCNFLSKHAGRKSFFKGMGAQALALAAGRRPSPPFL